MARFFSLIACYVSNRASHYLTYLSEYLAMETWGSPCVSSTGLPSLFSTSKRLLENSEGFALSTTIISVLFDQCETSRGVRQGVFGFTANSKRAISFQWFSGDTAVHWSVTILNWMSQDYRTLCRTEGSQDAWEQWVVTLIICCATFLQVQVKAKRSPCIQCSLPFGKNMLMAARSLKWHL